MKAARYFLLTIWISVSAFAQSKDALAGEIIQLTGVEETYTRLKLSSVEQAKQQMSGMIDQIKQQFDVIPPEVLDQILEAAERFMNSSRESWTVEDLVEYEKSLVVEYYTIDELKELIKFYRSPLGKKTIKASKELTPRVQKYLAEKSSVVTQRATETYISELQEIVRKVREGRMQ